MNSALSPSPTFTPSEYLDGGSQLGWWEAALTAATTIYSTIEANKRAKRASDNLVAAPAAAAPIAQPAAQWIGGVSNGVVLAGVGLVAVAVLALVVRR